MQPLNPYLCHKRAGSRQENKIKPYINFTSEVQNAAQKLTRLLDSKRNFPLIAWIKRCTIPPEGAKITSSWCIQLVVHFKLTHCNSLTKAATVLNMRQRIFGTIFGPDSVYVVRSRLKETCVYAGNAKFYDNNRA